MSNKKDKAFKIERITSGDIADTGVIVVEASTNDGKSSCRAEAYVNGYVRIRTLDDGHASVETWDGDKHCGTYDAIDPITKGKVGTITMTRKGNTFTSRRSWKKDGTRYSKSSVDADGMFAYSFSAQNVLNGDQFSVAIRKLQNNEAVFTIENNSCVRTERYKKYSPEVIAKYADAVKAYKNCEPRVAIYRNETKEMLKAVKEAIGEARGTGDSLGDF